MLRAQTEALAEILDNNIAACFEELNIEKARAASEKLEGRPFPSVLEALQRLWWRKQREIEALPETEHPPMYFLNLRTDIRRRSDYMMRHATGLRVLVALRAARPELLAEGGADIVGPLLEVFKGKESELTAIANTALLNLKKREAQEALANLALDETENSVRDLVFAAGYEPREPRQRALFFFLNGQWEKYESLDFDLSLLKMIYRTADKNLRRRIVEAARKGGRAELVRVIAGIKKRAGRKMPDMSRDEWQLTVELLLEGEKWAEAWEYAQAAPPVWSMPILRRLFTSGWRPERPAEAAAFTDMALLALDCTTDVPPLGKHIKLVQRLNTGNNPLNALALNLVAGHFAIGGDSRTVKIWNLQKRQPEQTIVHRIETELGTEKKWAEDSYRILSVAFSPNGRWLAFEECWQYATRPERWRRQVVLYDTERKSVVQTLRTVDIDESAAANLQPYQSVAFTRDSLRLAYDNVNGLIDIWEIERGRTDFYLRSNGRNCITFSPDGIYSATGNNAGLVRLYSMRENENGKQLTFSLADRRDVIINAICLTTDYEIIAACSDSRVRAWTRQGTGTRVGFSTHGAARALAVSPDGYRAISGHADGTLEFWSLPALSHISRFEEAHAGAVTCLSYTPDGLGLISTGADGSIGLWTSRLAEIAARPIEVSDIDDLLLARRASHEEDMPRQERYWWSFVEALLGWQWQHEIEIGDWSESEADLFDIEIEG
jgi:WD40 repeat protein